MLCYMLQVVNLLCWAVATAAALTVLYGLYHCYQGHTMSLSVLHVPVCVTCPCLCYMLQVVNLLCWAVASAAALTVLYGLYRSYQVHTMSLFVLHVTGCVTCYRLLHVTGCQPGVLGSGDSGSPDGAVWSVPLLSRSHHVPVCVTCPCVCYMSLSVVHVTGCQPAVLGSGDSGSPDGAVWYVPFLSRPHHVPVCVTCNRLCYMLQVVNLLCWAVATAAALTVLYGLYHCYQGHTMSLSVLHVPVCATCPCLCYMLQVVNLLCWAVATAAALTVLYGLYHCYQGHTMSLSVLHVPVCATCPCLCYMLQVVNLLCWAVATAAALTVLYGLYHCYQGHTMSLSVAALYNATFRSVWSVALAWVIFACVTGNGG